MFIFSAPCPISIGSTNTSTSLSPPNHHHQSRGAKLNSRVFSRGVAFCPLYGVVSKKRGEVCVKSGKRSITVSALRQNRKTLINISDADGCSALHFAAIAGNTQCIKTLVHYGADMTLIDAKGQSAIDVAAHRAARSALMKLHDAVNIACTFRPPAAAFDADVAGSASSGTELGEADEKREDNEGGSLASAVSSSSNDVRANETEGADVYDEGGDVDASTTDVDKGDGSADACEADSRDVPSGTTSMNNEGQTWVMMQTLVDSGESLNSRQGVLLRTPLHLAAAAGNAKVIEYLINAGANPRIRDSNGWTPLHVVVSEGSSRHYADAARALLANGCPIDDLSNSGCSALHIAAATPVCLSPTLPSS